MGILIHLLSCLACLQMAYLYPVQDEPNPLFDEYRMKVAKRDSFYPFKESLLSSLGLLENSREGTQSQRKKAVDSTFIRFGRSSSSEGLNREGNDEHEMPTFPKSMPELQRGIENAAQETSPEITDSSKTNFLAGPPRLILNHNGCRVVNSRELVRALMNDRNCIRAFQKVKRENVNDTFIRFGKREAPPEKAFESQNSNGEAYTR